MFTNATITHYSKKKGYKRQSYKAYVEMITASSDTKEGSVKKDSVFVSIPTNYKIDFAKGDLIILSEIIFDFDCETEKEESDSLKALKQSNDVYAISTVTPCLYGSKAVWHYELECD